MAASAAAMLTLLNAPVDIDAAQKKASELLQVLENHLRERNRLQCDRLTIADIACFPYIANV